MANIPSFLKEKDNKILYNNDDGSEFVFYISEDYFTDTKLPVAKIVGQYVETIGIMDWAIVLANGKMGEFKPFKFPSMISCKPNRIEKVKNYKINGLRAKDYRVLHFGYGDEIISDVNVPEALDNAELVFKILAINGGKTPPTIAYDKMQDYFTESMELSGNSYNVNMQLFGILIREICRDPHDISKNYISSNPNNMNEYVQIPITMIPKFTSPFVALTSQNWDESLMASILLSDEDEDKIKSSPLEKVVMS